ncbi:uncharacterized, partial [Tachysurus ichikawai]
PAISHCSFQTVCDCHLLKAVRDSSKGKETAFIREKIVCIHGSSNFETTHRLLHGGK